MARDPKSLNDVLDVLREAAEGETVSVQDVLEHVGTRSFAPLLLVPALILISPISGIPGTPTIGAIVILLIAGQAVFGREHLWLPGFVQRQHLSGPKFRRALDRLQGPVNFIDRHTHTRLSLLAHRPLSFIAISACVALAAIMPLLELFPMVTSIAATAIAFLALGLMVSDGVLMILGYGVIAGWAALLSKLIWF